MFVHYSKSDHTGCAFYRMELPCIFLERFAGQTAELGVLSTVGKTNLENILVIQRQYFPEAFGIIAHKRRFGIPVVGELDDDFWALEDDNPAKRVYNPEHILEAERLARERGELREGEFFLQTRKFLGEFFRTCDAVTVPTEPLAEVLRRFNDNVYVLPNYIDDTVLQYYPSPLKTARTFRILWTGSNTHRNDLIPALSAVKRLMDEYPQVRFIVIGATFPEMEALPKEKCEFYPGFPDVRDYYRLLATVPAHVGIAPLQENTFNRSKCLDAETRVTTGRGVLPVCRIVPGDTVWHEGRWVPVEGTEHSPSRQGLCVVTRMGYTVKLTPEHRMLVNGGWVTADRIVPGDVMSMEPETPPSLPYAEAPWPPDGRASRGGFDPTAFVSAPDAPRVRITPRWGRVLGAFVGDGNTGTSTSVQISCDGQDQDWIDLLTDDFRAMGFNPTTEQVTTYGGEVLRRRGVRVASAHLRRFLRNLGVIEATEAGGFRRVVKVPDVIWESPEEVIVEFLAGYFEADGGCVSSGVRASSKDKPLLQGVQRLLLLFGIQSSLTARTGHCQNGFVGEYWDLSLRRAAADVFSSRIGFRSARKQTALRGIVQKPHSNAYRPMVWQDEVVSVTPCDVTPVDLQVEGSVFSAAGLVSHNSDIKAKEYGMAGYLPVLQDYAPYRALPHGAESILYVQGHTEQAWHDALAYLIENPEHIQERAREFQGTVISHYGMSRNIHKWVDVYGKILNQKKKNTYFPDRVPRRVQK